MAEQELRDLIQQAWCDGDSNPKDKFGDFLNRAAKRIKEAGYVQLAENQSLPELNLPTLAGNKPLEIAMESFAKKIRNDMLDSNFRKVK